MAIDIEKARAFLEATLPDEQWDENEHLLRTPERFATMLHNLTHPDWEESDFTTFPNALQLNEMVVIREIPFYSLCAHHVIPFFGVAHIGYVPEPDGLIAGISKFPRAVRHWAKGLWVQEELCDYVAFWLTEQLKPMGLAVVMEAEHLCMSMRGIQTPGVKTITSSMHGVFLDPERKARDEFLSLIRSK